MKKVLLTALLAWLGAASASATQFWYDVVTNYPTGGITTNTALWYPHLPGSLTAHDTLVVSNGYTSGAAVNGKRLRINGLNSEYVMRLFDPVNTNPVVTGSVYASFIVNANFVPAAGVGTYFAAFNDLGSPASATNGFNFRGRVYQIGNTNVYPFTTTTAGTYLFGIANAAGDPAQGGSPSILYPPIDLIKNVDYQVVVKYVIDDGNPVDASTATMWINPASESDTANMAGPTSDSGATLSLAGLIFRQRTAGGTVDIRDIVVGDTFASVMTNATPGPVMIATNYLNLTNYAGNPALFEVFATSIGGGALQYQWYKIAGGTTNPVTGAIHQTCLIASPGAADAGAYFCAVTNWAGMGAWSKTNYFVVNATPTPPTFKTQPVSAGASIGSTITLTTSAYGTGPLAYQWSYSGAPLTDGQPVTVQPGDLSVVSGSQTPTLTVTGLSTNDTGNYSVTVTGPVAPGTVTSTNAVVTVRPPQAVSIAFLRSLESTTTWQTTDTTSTYAISGVVTTRTNLTSGTTASYYIQDSTAGIDLFVTGDATFRPQQGDLVAASGTLSSYNNGLELGITAGNPYQYYTIVSHGNTVPAPAVFSMSFTNNAGNMETNFEGRLVMLTNVFFQTPGAVFTGNANVIVTNKSGSAIIVYVSSQVADVLGQTIPASAYSIVGAMAQFKSGTTYSSAGYEVNLTDIADLITTPPPTVSVAAALSGSNVALSWTAVPYNYSYSVLSASNVAGPYTPLMTGLTFTSTAGQFTDTNGIGALQKFYRIVSP